MKAICRFLEVFTDIINHSFDQSEREYTNSLIFKRVLKQLSDEAEYHLKNYGHRRGCDNTLRDLHNSSDDTEAEFNNCFIIHSK